MSDIRIQTLRGLISNGLLPDNIRALVLFGSVASGKANTQSDVNYLFIRDSGETDMIYTPEEETVMGRMASSLGFPSVPSGSYSLENLRADEKNMDQILFQSQFLNRLELAKKGIRVLGLKDPNTPFIASWLVLARTPEEEAQITQTLLDTRVRLLK